MTIGCSDEEIISDLDKNSLGSRWYVWKGVGGWGAMKS